MKRWGRCSDLQSFAPAGSPTATPGQWRYRVRNRILANIVPQNAAPQHLRFWGFGHTRTLSGRWMSDRCRGRVRLSEGPKRLRVGRGCQARGRYSLAFVDREDADVPKANGSTECGRISYTPFAAGRSPSLRYCRRTFAPTSTGARSASFRLSCLVDPLANRIKASGLPNILGRFWVARVGRSPVA
jgi:hypothetical protein